MPEQFRFQQVFRQRRTVHGNQGLVCPGAAAVQGAGHQFLAGAGFTGDEHRCFRGGHGGDDFLHGADGGAASQNARTRRRLAQLAAQFTIFNAEARMLDGLFKRVPQGFKIQRLHKIIVCAEPKRLHRGLHGGVRRHEHHRQGRVILQDVPERMYAVHARHAHIRQHGVKRLFAHQGHGLVAIRGLLHCISPRAQHGAQHSPVRIVIINNQYAGAHQFLSSRLARCRVAASRSSFHSILVSRPALFFGGRGVRLFRTRQPYAEGGLAPAVRLRGPRHDIYFAVMGFHYLVHHG